MASSYPLLHPGLAQSGAKSSQFGAPVEPPEDPAIDRDAADGIPSGMWTTALQRGLHVYNLQGPEHFQKFSDTIPTTFLWKCKLTLVIPRQALSAGGTDAGLLAKIPEKGLKVEAKGEDADKKKAKRNASRALLEKMAKISHPFAVSLAEADKPMQPKLPDMALNEALQKTNLLGQLKDDYIQEQPPNNYVRISLSAPYNVSCEGRAHDKGEAEGRASKAIILHPRIAGCPEAQQAVDPRLWKYLRAQPEISRVFKGAVSSSSAAGVPPSPTKGARPTGEAQAAEYAAFAPAPQAAAPAAQPAYGYKRAGYGYKPEVPAGFGGHGAAPAYGPGPAQGHPQAQAHAQPQAHGQWQGKAQGYGDMSPQSTFSSVTGLTELHDIAAGRKGLHAAAGLEQKYASAAAGAGVPQQAGQAGQAAAAAPSTPLALLPPELLRIIAANQTSSRPVRLPEACLHMLVLWVARGLVRATDLQAQPSRYKSACGLGSALLTMLLRHASMRGRVTGDGQREWGPLGPEETAATEQQLCSNKHLQEVLDDVVHTTLSILAMYRPGGPLAGSGHPPRPAGPSGSSGGSGGWGMQVDFDPEDGPLQYSSRPGLGGLPATRSSKAGAAGRAPAAGLTALPAEFLEALGSSGAASAHAAASVPSGQLHDAEAACLDRLRAVCYSEDRFRQAVGMLPALLVSGGGDASGQAVILGRAGSSWKGPALQAAVWMILGHVLEGGDPEDATVGFTSQPGRGLSATGAGAVAAQPGMNLGTASAVAMQILQLPATIAEA